MASVNDIVLIYLEESPVSFARVENIVPDTKKDWFHIKLLMLQIPLQVVTWTLKDDYINGDEFFMGGKQMRLKKVECPPDELQQQAPAPETPPPAKQETGQIISFTDLQKKPSE
jgi:hypothetical protein